MDEIDNFWTIKDVSDYLRISVATLYYWRVIGRGPSGRRMGKHIRYNPDDVIRWADEQDGK